MVTIQVCVFQSANTGIWLSRSIHFGLVLEKTFYHVAYHGAVGNTSFHQVFLGSVGIRSGSCCWQVGHFVTEEVDIGVEIYAQSAGQCFAVA